MLFVYCAMRTTGLTFVASRRKDNNNNSKVLTSSILMAQIWKAPDVAKSHAESHLSQKILYFTVPPCPSSSRLRRSLLTVLASGAIELRLCGHSLVIIAWQWLLLHLRKWKSKRKSQQVKHMEATRQIMSSNHRKSSLWHLYFHVAKLFQ